VPVIKKRCQVRYEYAGRTEASEGIVLYRPISNVGPGPLRWGDLRSGRQNKGGPLYSSCSTKKQVQIRHERSACPGFVDVAVLGE
jgi:hypothetical protein